MEKTAVLLVNVGTPNEPKVGAVRKYLYQFLNDRRVIDLPWLLQKFLVNFIIVPFRAPKSTKLYKLLWKPSGSPLLTYSVNFKDKLQKILPEGYTVYLAMRYGNPSLKVALKDIETENFDGVIVLPMFPQYASSTTGTVNAYIANTIKKWYTMPDMLFLNQFYTNKGFLQSFVNRAKEYKYQDFDHIIFSYHGLPLRQVNKSHPAIDCNSCTCAHSMPNHGKWCYKAQCYDTSQLLAKELELEPDKYTVAFQSRLSKNWLEPFSDKVVIDLAEKGVKKLLILAPAFVADCLETEVEIGIEYAELFKEHGGTELVMAKSLNAEDYWVKAVAKMIQS